MAAQKGCRILNAPHHRRDTARFKLRDQTAAAHDRVDALFSTVDLADRHEYGRFLTAQAKAFLPAEQGLEQGGIAEVLIDWPERRRSHLLIQDLEALGLTVPDVEPPPPLAGTSALLGGAYVLEGSRLGGAMLRRAVPDDLPAAFLSASYPGGWRTLIFLLDERLTSDLAMDEAVAAAQAVFTLFERSAQQMTLEGDTPVA